MRTDRELLELAAKAAGLDVWGGQWPQDDMLFVAPKSPDPSGKVTGVEWNPLTDDGDALRLLCAKSMRVVEDNGGAYRAVQFTLHPETDEEVEHEVEIEWPHSPAATRRAIVRAAAAIASKVTA